MRTLATLLLLGLLATITGCATHSAKIVYLDNELQDPLESLPEEYEAEPTASQADLFLSAMNAIDDETVFSVEVELEGTRLKLWTNEEFESGIDPDDDPSLARMQEASRFVFLRMSPGPVTIHARKGDGPVKSREITLEGGERHTWVIAFSAQGILIESFALK